MGRLTEEGAAASDALLGTLTLAGSGVAGCVARHGDLVSSSAPDTCRKLSGDQPQLPQPPTNWGAKRGKQQRLGASAGLRAGYGVVGQHGQEGHPGTDLIPVLLGHHPCG